MAVKIRKVEDFSTNCPDFLPGATVTEDGMKALALVDAPDHVCCRYRIGAFAPTLAAEGWNLEIEGLARGTLGRVRQIGKASRYDAVILQRKLLPGWQLRLLRRKTPHLVFDYDDAVLYRDSYDTRGPDSARRARRFAATVGLADVVTAGNDFLADCALRAGANPDRVRVIPTCVSSEKYPNRAERCDGEGKGLDLVWVGSSSTLQGLEQERGLWDRLGREVPGVRLRVICDRFPDLGAMPIVKVGWSEQTEAREIAAGDVGVTWIPDDAWSRGKCGLKVLQYQAAGLPVIANAVGVHGEIVRPGLTGWLPESVEGWVEAVRMMRNDPELRQRMGRAARESVEANYSVRAWEGTFVAALAGFSTGNASRGESHSKLSVASTAGPMGVERSPSRSRPRTLSGRGPIGVKG